MKLILLQVCILLFALSCSDNKKIPDHILKPEKMEAVLADVMMADALNQERIIRDSLLYLPRENVSYFKKIFQLHVVTKEDFEKSIQFYTKRPDLMRAIIDSVSAVVSRKNTLIEAKKDTVTTKSDTIKSKLNGRNFKKIARQPRGKQ
jgi:hypothetical protein